MSLLPAVRRASDPRIRAAGATSPASGSSPAAAASDASASTKAGRAPGGIRSAMSHTSARRLAATPSIATQALP